MQYHNPVECQKLGIRNREFHTSLENNWEHFIAGHSCQEWKQYPMNWKKKNTKSKLQHTTLECCDDNKKRMNIHEKKREFATTASTNATNLEDCTTTAQHGGNHNYTEWETG